MLDGVSEPTYLFNWCWERWVAARGNSVDAIDIPDIDGPSESPKMPTKQLGALSLDADTSITNIPDMDEIPDMEEEGLDGVEDAATAAPAKSVAK